MKAGNRGGTWMSAGVLRCASLGLRPAALTVTAAAALLTVGAPCAHAQQTRVTFDIASQSLDSALRAFSAQSKQQVLFDEDTVAGRTAPAVHGTLTPREALDRVLAGSGIQVIVSRSGAYTLKRSASDDTAAQLPTTNVTADASRDQPAIGYVANTSSAGAKTDLALIKTPQAISVVTRDQMDVQNVQSVAQALRYTSGINPEQRGTNTDSLEYLYARGFQVEEYLNGLRLPGAIAGYNVTSFDPYMLERIEFVHGPASVLYGQGSPGGVVNLQSKMPTDTPMHEIGVQTGSYGRAQLFADFSGPLDQDGKVLYRITGDAFRTGTQTNNVREKRFAIAPSLTWRPTQDTSLTVFASYQVDPEAGNYNFVPVVGTVKPGAIMLPRGLDIGDPDFDSFRKTQASIGYAFSHAFNDVWSFKQNYRFLHNTQTVKYVSYDSLSADQTTINRTPYMNSGTVNMHTLDNQLSAKFALGTVTQKVTVGLDYQHLQYDHDFLGSFDDTPSLSIANPVYGQSIPYPNFMFGTSGAQRLDQLGAYAQDLIEVGRWTFLAGVRQDWTDEEFVPYKAGSATTSQSNHAFTWRLGGVYKFDNGIAPYASYSTSFAPQIGTDFSGKSFVPTTGKQFEVGVKFQPRGYNSFVTVSGFHLTQDNVTTADPAHTNFSVQTGQVRSRGIELEAHASLTNNLQLIANYTYTNLVNTQSNSVQGKSPVGIPRNMASAWADYTVKAGNLSGLQFGGGVRYVGATYGDAANSFQVPSVTLVDLSVRYDLGRRFPGMRGWLVSLNASNLFDRRFVSSCSGDTCNWGQGRIVLAGLKYNW
ncbi:Ferrichrome-iron receptor [Pandoraea pneumonica]|uniref:Ferrichrome-iron receptor n=1 Tax=Pandoraea pneumonica TaxID=2508299 RepID=A0A5E4RIL4_9BURK|nr:TonB-dependent siderophore receptor [Pandoraea pneumonica]VVD62332.1 Ferrichrome-iron receptor [Pandoraea pneumonica]